jgi:hypothetical protein
VAAAVMGTVDAGAEVAVGAVAGTVKSAWWLLKFHLKLRYGSNEDREEVVKEAKDGFTKLVGTGKSQVHLLGMGLKDPGAVIEGAQIAGVRQATQTTVRAGIEAALVVEGSVALAGKAKTLVRGGGNPAGEAEFLFRGTTEGYPGSPALQRLGVTPTSTDPAVATIFAVEASNFGKGVVQIAPRGLVPTIEGNVLAALEAEIGVELLPLEFAKRARPVSVDVARGTLREMGIDIPERIPDKAHLDAALRSRSQMSAEQIREFQRRVQEKSR